MTKPYLDTTPSAHADYRQEKQQRIAGFADDAEFRALSERWRAMALERKYMNNFSWLGRPMIQLPMDAMAMQEIIWAVKPDLIVETGVAHGGSVVLSASMLQLLGHGEVLGVDIEIRPHNRQAIESHPMAHRIRLVEGSSTAPEVVAQVRAAAAGKQRVLVFLDSNHTHEHVLAELNAYADLVSVGSYCVVFDTFVEDMPDDYVWTERPWGKGNNPKTAVWEYLRSHPEFQIDKSVEDKLLVTSAPDGFLRRVA
ncbi:cephalosporin hydroxylase family protein [Pseudorhodoferax sp. Leaf265]|uniref:cephalosporin hydroxylase family protein n=1 Tax=Pseudorhodoferax sp. Leaf265 TaxID=1736315 RepID=UPI0006FA4680|nr:cephalosporin hydroxylase family protein [Pseudorhodoferax sp. Leaf265]KQP08317.1 cephalosporin hydroxylase [Pseudorhodoferax sp. Leaf265]